MWHFFIFHFYGLLSLLHSLGMQVSLLQVGKYFTTRSQKLAGASIATLQPLYRSEANFSTEKLTEKASHAASLKAKLRAEKVKKSNRAVRERRYQLVDDGTGKKVYKVNLTPAQQRRKKLREALRLAMDAGNTDSVPALVDFLKKTNPNTRRGAKFGMLLDTVVLKGKSVPMGEYMREMDRINLMSDPNSPGVGTYLTEASELDFDGSGDLENLSGSIGQLDDPSLHAVAGKMNKRLTGILSGRKHRIAGIITNLASNILTIRQLNTIKKDDKAFKLPNFAETVVQLTKDANLKQSATTKSQSKLPSKPLVVEKVDPKHKNKVIQEQIGHIDLYNLNWFISRVVVSPDLGHATVYWCAPCLLPSKDADPLHDKYPELLQHARSSLLNPIPSAGRLDILTPDEHELVDTVKNAIAQKTKVPSELIHAASKIEARSYFFKGVRPKFHSGADGFGLPAIDLQGNTATQRQIDFSQPNSNIINKNRGMTVAQERAIRIVAQHTQRYLDAHIPTIRWKLGKELNQKLIPNIAFTFDEKYVNSLLRENSLETTLYKVANEMSSEKRAEYLKSSDKRNILAGLNVPGWGLVHEDGSRTLPEDLKKKQMPNSDDEDYDYDDFDFDDYEN